MCTNTFATASHDASAKHRCGHASLTCPDANTYADTLREDIGDDDNGAAQHACMLMRKFADVFREKCAHAHSSTCALTRTQTCEHSMNNVERMQPSRRRRCAKAVIIRFHIPRSCPNNGSRKRRTAHTPTTTDGCRQNRRDESRHTLLTRRYF